MVHRRPPQPEPSCPSRVVVPPAFARPTRRATYGASARHGATGKRHAATRLPPRMRRHAALLRHSAAFTARSAPQPLVNQSARWFVDRFGLVDAETADILPCPGDGRGESAGVSLMSAPYRTGADCVRRRAHPDWSESCPQFGARSCVTGRGRARRAVRADRSDSAVGGRRVRRNADDGIARIGSVPSKRSSSACKDWTRSRMP